MNYLFRAKTREGSVVKIVSEYYSNTLKYPPLSILEDGIHLNASSPYEENSEIDEVLCTMHWPNTNFVTYNFTKPLHFFVNATNFYRLLKSTKKKNSITLFISKDSPMELGISVEQAGDQKPTTSFIKLTYIQPEEMEIPTGYTKFITAMAKEFQQLKNLHTVSSEMTVKLATNSGNFICDGENLFSRRVPMGSQDTDFAEDMSQCDKKDNEYSQTFTTQRLTLLTKCPGNEGNVQIYYHHDLPLKIRIKTGNMGTLDIYIKSHELMGQEIEDNKKRSKDTESGLTYDFNEFSFNSAPQHEVREIEVLPDEDNDPIEEEKIPVKPKKLKKVSKKNPKLEQDEDLKTPVSKKKILLHALEDISHASDIDSNSEDDVIKPPLVKTKIPNKGILKKGHN